jgi:hypothetical protein
VSRGVVIWYQDSRPLRHFTVKRIYRSEYDAHLHSSFASFLSLLSGE